MTINLQKGGNVNLSKEAPGMTCMLLGLGWNARATDGVAFDLDATAFLLNDMGKVRSDADVVFYNQKASADGSVKHSGDNITGEGCGDDEALTIDLSCVPTDVERIVICVTIHEADVRMQNFGMVSSAYVRCVNANSSTEIANFDLTEDGSVETAMIFGEVYRYSGEWKFKAIGSGFKGGFGALARNFGAAV